MAQLVGNSFQALYATAIATPVSSENTDTSNSLNALSTDVVSTGTLTWTDSGVSFELRFDNSRILSEQKIDPASIHQLVEKFRDDLANDDRSLGFSYAGLLQGELPVLFVVHASTAGQLTESRSRYTIINLNNFLASLKEIAEFSIFVIDRNGTLLLHPLQEKAIRRENLGNHSLAQILKADPAETGRFRATHPKDDEETLGAFYRIPGTGFTVIAETQEGMALELVVKLQKVFGLVAFFIFTLTLVLANRLTKMSAGLVTEETGSRKAEQKEPQLRLVKTR
ncbi:MAG: hypothetical protein AB1540_04500 [Bdellovibrionota bacterium]